MMSLYLLAVVAAFSISSLESAPSTQGSAIAVDEVNERLRRQLIGGLLGGGGGGGGIIGGLLGGGGEGGGIIGGLLGDGAEAGGFLGGTLDSLLGLVGGVVGPVVSVVTGVLDTVVKLVGSLVEGLAGAKSPEEQKSVFDKYELKDLCPVCSRLPNPEQVKACDDYCSSKNYKAARHLLLL
jgi:hypothetical protein